VSDPCMLDIDGFIVGLTSTDILFHLGAEEISGYVLCDTSKIFFFRWPWMTLNGVMVVWFALFHRTW